MKTSRVSGEELSADSKSPSQPLFGSSHNASPQITAAKETS